MEKGKCKQIQQILIIILFANLFVAVLKILIGTLIRSAGMTADGFHSLADGSSNIVGLIGIRFASKPEDKEHPYGHNKFETLTGLFISGMLFATGAKVIYNAISAFRHPVDPQITIISLIAMIVTLGVNILVSTTEYRRGRELESAVLVSDSMHTRSDIYVSIGVLLTLAGIRCGLPAIIDPIASLVVAGFILHAACEIARENCDVLLDRVAADTEEIRQIAMNFEQVKDTHNIRSRGCQSSLYVDMHLMVEPYLNISESHRLVHEIENAIRANINQNAQVIIHLEPYPDEDTVNS